MTRVATIQMISTPDLDANLAQAGTLLEEAADDAAEFALIPEYFALLSDNEYAKLDIAEEFGRGPIQDWLSGQAVEKGLWLMAGAVPLRSTDPGRVASACLLYDPQGNCTGRYDKIHLFDVCVDREENESYRESKTIVPGREVVTAKTGFATLGLSICYDLRFPELYRQLAQQGAQVFTVPSAFTYSTGQRHWQMLLSARAVENLCFVIAANQGGQNTPNRRTWGHSMIIDPWGNILASLEEGPGVACADLDLNAQQSLRESFPALEHRIIGN